ncbi:MAG: peptide-methionine (R)-S-oxide reductase [Bacteroidales bacterium]|nr:peptide-methionine (R)-S-oxide reductase [Bacteroidales bacterium]
MGFRLFILLILSWIVMTGCTQENKYYNSLTPEEERVIHHKGTEMPYTGKYVNFKENGTYTCKQCDAVLFKSEDKFD